MNRRQLLTYGVFGLGATALAPGLARSGPRAAQSQTARDRIERIAIHPALGIARVGNSPDEWFLGPEAPGSHPLPPEGFKDSAGRIKRQAARFRLYGFDAEGEVVGEVTAAAADIRWRVHLANSKAAWYSFDLPFDIPGAKGLPAGPGLAAPPPTRSLRRNAPVADRASLAIDPGARSVGGRNANADGQDAGARFAGGMFFDIEVPLGELRTDDAGRLLVLGGSGESGPAAGGLEATDIDNNDLWYDDTSDGPVDATVSIAGRAIPVTGAWVVVAPPNYAPGIQSVVTMYDVMFEAATILQPELAPVPPSFTRMIYPMFARLVQNQWVNAGFLHRFGWGAASDFLAPEQLRRLASPSPQHRPLRQEVFARFRDPAYTSMNYDELPPYYGDSVNFPGTDPRQWLAVLPIQYGWLRQWAAGDFEADWPAAGLTFPARLEDVPIAAQPAMLDRAVLDDCLGGPFHPGCELTWPMRQPLLYAEPFRLRRRVGVEPDWGPAMTSELALAADGPLRASGPGDLTRWLAVPWQTDTASCLSAYERSLDEYLPAFWPAHVPNDVLAPASYQVVLNPAASLGQRQDAFTHRVKWLRDLPGFGRSNRERMNAFVAQWSAAGIVTPQPGPEDDAPFPATFWVELGHALVDESSVVSK